MTFAEIRDFFILILILLKEILSDLIEALQDDYLFEHIEQ